MNRSVESESKKLPLLEVRSQRYILNSEIDSSLSILSKKEIRTVAPKHPNEIFSRVPGAWISTGSGQEHLTAIRSPVLTGAGACGAFMVLEDDVPTRPSGFCNVNQLFEVNIRQARRMDVLRGPGTVTYGSNALHGAISVLTPGPAARTFSEYSLEAGTDNYYRGSYAMSGAHSALQASYTDSGSFRDAESFRHGLFNLQLEHTAGRFSGRTSFAYANLDQDTAGYIPGRNSYKNELLRTKNLNPGAFREAWATRLSSRWNWLTQNGSDLELIPYVRSNRMDFLQHFLPGTPLEENGQDSAGLLFSWSNNEELSSGIDLEWAIGELLEFQENAIETGSDFLKETRPQGFHYDYGVQATTLAAWTQWQAELATDLALTAGLRAEYLKYEYDNRMLDGNTRDDGSECGYGGCLYTRPADRGDSFTNLSPELGLRYSLSDQQAIYVRFARGYRAPQATELYRLQKGQTVAGLDLETLDSLEFGINGATDVLSYEVIAYVMRKNNFIFRDANGFNISDGKTRHSGIESLLVWQATGAFRISANLSLARHLYDFNRDLGRGEIILKGNEIDTAPAWLGGLRMLWQPDSRKAIEAEWVYQGGYFLDAANTHCYPGHNLLNLRGWINIKNSHHTVSLRLTNLLDTRYAERADYAFGNYWYFPGAGRRFNLDWMYRR
ncbi:MAG: TonB-dependent receptor [Gammaproteobacteria bacterium]|nr:TonB-dependent receptor [Gammaproteobacteria bacterium]